MTDTVRIQNVRIKIDGDLFLYVLQDSHKKGTVNLWLSDRSKDIFMTVLPRHWCPELVGRDYEGFTVTEVSSGALAVLIDTASEWAYLYRDAQKEKISND